MCMSVRNCMLTWPGPAPSGKKQKEEKKKDKNSHAPLFSDLLRPPQPQLRPKEQITPNWTTSIPLFRGLNNSQLDNNHSQTTLSAVPIPGGPPTRHPHW